MTPEQIIAETLATVDGLARRQGGPPERLCLYLPRSRDHQLALSLGLVQLERPDHTAVVKGIERAMFDRGWPVEIVRVSPARLVEVMERQGLLSTPDGRAAALAFIASSQPR
jgi:hypothetical protein